MRAFFRSTPRSLIEAARIDGASSFGVLWRVLLPQAMAGRSLTLCVLVFIYTWNEFLLALVLIQDRDSRPRRSASRSSPAPRAPATRRRSPPRRCSSRCRSCIVYVFLQRHFIRGMLAGAIKE